MKNKSVRNFLFVFLIIFSVASHAYVNSKLSTTANIELSTDEIELDDLSKKNETTLPDVKIIKKATEFIINMLPTSR